MTADLKLVKTAGEVTEILLSSYKRRDEMLQKLLTENLHYIMNSLGFDKLQEADYYLSCNQNILKNIIQTLHAQGHAKRDG